MNKKILEAVHCLLEPVYDRGLTASVMKASELASWKREVRKSGLLRELRKKIKELTGARGPFNTGSIYPFEGIYLYALIRKMKPEFVLETGVSRGMSTLFLLAALKKNEKGVLHSIEIAPLTDGTVGELIPDSLRGRWQLHMGDSTQILPQLLKQHGSPDFFFHDSDHSYEAMRREYEEVYPKLRDGGILASDDTHRHRAFQEFAAKENRKVYGFGTRIRFLIK